MTSKEMLSSILKTVQMGQIGIRSVLDTPVSRNLRGALQSQLREYDTLETQAHSLAALRNWEVPELNPSIRWMTNWMTKAKLSGSDTDSRAAEMMIQGNTRGMIKSLKNLHNFTNSDDTLRTLSQKLLDCEIANIRQMQGYL